MQQYLWLFLCGVLGIIYSNTQKVISLRRKGKEIDFKFKISDYLASDFDIIIIQFLTVCIGLISWKYFSDQSWSKYSEFIFIGIGVIGSQILNMFWSTAEKQMISRLKNYSGSNQQVLKEGEDTNIGGGTVGTPK